MPNPAFFAHSPVDTDEQMLTKHCISGLVSRSDQDRNAKTTAGTKLFHNVLSLIRTSIDFWFLSLIFHKFFFADFVLEFDPDFFLPVWRIICFEFIYDLRYA